VSLSDYFVGSWYLTEFWNFKGVPRSSKDSKCEGTISKRSSGLTAQVESDRFLRKGSF
jgi:hypothetical protein